MLREMIQRRIIEHARTAVFYVVTYDKETQLPNIITSSSEKAHPPSVRVNELTETFSVDSNHGLSLQLKQDDWNLQLKLSFNQEVSLEAYKLDLMRTPFTFPADPTNGLPFTIIRVSKISAFHPIQQQPKSGTEATVVFVSDKVRL